MKVAVIFSTPFSEADVSGWRWRTEDQTADPSRAFESYSDCAADAKRSGFSVRLGHVEAAAEAAELPAKRRARAVSSGRGSFPQLVTRRDYYARWVWELLAHDRHVLNRSDCSFSTRTECEADAVKNGQTLE